MKSYKNNSQLEGVNAAIYLTVVNSFIRKGKTYNFGDEYTNNNTNYNNNNNDHNHT
jgi:hypothetical protein